MSGKKRIIDSINNINDLNDSNDLNNSKNIDNHKNISIFAYKNIRDIIIEYLTIIDIINLSLCCKEINEVLDPENNTIINFIYLIEAIYKIFELDPASNYIIKNKYILSGKKIKFGLNYKVFLKEIISELDVYKDNPIGKRIKDFIKIHIFIKILREKLLFEESLIKFPELLTDYVNNKNLFDFVNYFIFNSDYNKIDYIYMHNPSFINDNCENSHLRQIFNFILWVIHLFIMYCTFNYETVNGLYTYIDNAEFMQEFLAKKNDLYNCALLINSTFENINIIINFLKIYKDIYDVLNKNTYLSLSNYSSSDSESNIQNNQQINMKDYVNKIISPIGKFTLYNLFLKIIDDLYIKKINSIPKVFQQITKEVIVEKFSVNSQELINKVKKEEEKMNISCEEDENEICDDEEDDDFSLDLEPSNKELCENCMISFFDIYINGLNANAIMHSNLKINNDYIDNYEKILGNILEEQIKHSYNKDKMPISQIFDIVEKKFIHK